MDFDVLKKLTSWPATKIMPVLDLLRMFFMHPQGSELFKVFEVGYEHLSVILSALKTQKESVPTVILGLRCIVNMFENNSSRYLLQQKR